MNPTPPLLATTPEQILRRLEWRVIRRLDGLFQGNYRTLFYGSGIDIADIREYQLRDDIRHIDWNVTARMNSPYVRQFVEDREITAWFLLDLTRSMTFGPVERRKEFILIDCVTTFARLLTRDGNRIGAIVYHDHSEVRSPRVIPPNTGRNQVLRIIRDLLSTVQMAPRTPPGSTTQLTTLLQAGLNTFKRRSMVFIFSDFISEPGWDQSLSNLNRRHELLAVRIYDPREAALPDAGLIVVEDLETGEHLYVDTADAGFRRRFADMARERAQALDTQIRRTGSDLMPISTEDDIVDAISRLATLRKRRQR